MPTAPAWKLAAVDDKDPAELRVRPLVAGRYLISAESAASEISTPTSAEVRDGSLTEVVLTLGPVRCVSGRVLDATAGSPLAGARVEAGDAVVLPRGTGFTSVDGAFKLRSLPVEKVALTVSRSGYVSRVVVVEPSATAPLEVLLERLGNLRITLSSQFIAEHSAPLDLVLIRQDGGASLLEELEGQQCSIELSAGTWIVDIEPGEASDDGDAWAPQEQTIEIRAGETTVVDVG